MSQLAGTKITSPQLLVGCVDHYTIEVTTLAAWPPYYVVSRIYIDHSSQLNAIRNRGSSKKKLMGYEKTMDYLRKKLGC